MRFVKVALAFALAFTGCAYPGRYSKVVTMETDGKLIASWTAKGWVWRTNDGYRFTAVERRINNPPREFRYPLGRRVRTLAPRTVIYRTEEPAWLKNLSPLEIADAAEDGLPIRGDATQPLQ